LLDNALISIIVAISGITVLREVGIDIGPILATAGIGGLAIGFGAQSLVKDVISGFFILMEDQIRVGDVVEIEKNAGILYDRQVVDACLRLFCERNINSPDRNNASGTLFRSRIRSSSKNRKPMISRSSDIRR